MKKTYTIGISPCPNDTFIFYALLNKKIDTLGLDFNVVFEDVSALNKMAFDDTLDITKLSYHTYAYVREHYKLLESGSALGNNCGPLLIAKRQLTDEEILNGSVAIPGKYTTANFLLKYKYPSIEKIKTFLFSKIEDAVLTGKTDMGLIIHENRFTYQDKGLIKIADLGEYWEQTTQLPIPLGGIVIKKSIEESISISIDRLIAQSIEYAYENEHEVLTYCQQYAQEMDFNVMKSHIGLYVNEYSLKLGQKGKKAINHLLSSIS